MSQRPSLAKRHEYCRKLQARRLDSQDKTVSQNGRDKRNRIDLGLALLSAIALPGVRYTTMEIAAWCGCTDAAILLIEKRALQKLRRTLSPRLMNDLAAHLHSR